MPFSHGNTADNIGNTMNKRLMVFVDYQAFFAWVLQLFFVI